MMKSASALWASLIGTVFVALCCFTPILVIALGALGLGAWIGHLDAVLLPAVGGMVALTLYQYWRYRRGSTQPINPSSRPEGITKDCCPASPMPTSVSFSACPANGAKGKSVKVITLKSLLNPEALATLQPTVAYRFCASTDCSVVYFSETGQTFTTADLKVPVFQKTSAGDVLVCYCFGWTRQALAQERQQQTSPRVLSSIQTHVKAGRCGCEVNNPQGRCCLANVQRVLVER